MDSVAAGNSGSVDCFRKRRRESLRIALAADGFASDSFMHKGDVCAGLVINSKREKINC